MEKITKRWYIYQNNYRRILETLENILIDCLVFVDTHMQFNFKK